jgi:putative ABC transport system permease protein
VLGRNFTHAEDQPNAPRVALLSYFFWKSRFNGDPGAIGRAISVDGQPVNIVGVLPQDFELFNLSAIDLLIPEAINEAHPGNGRVFRAFARLRSGVSVEQARAAMEPLFERTLADVPPQFRRELHLVIRPLRDRQIGDMRVASWTLFGAVLVVLLIASANVANLMLARSASRRQEWSIRAAIGAGRGRLARQVLTESLLLAGMGAVAGCGLAWLLLRFFVAMAPTGILRLDQASLDGRVLLFAVGLSLASGLLFGFAPALDTPSAGGMAGRTVVSGRGVLRHVLIAAQIAASLVLLTGAGLLLRSLWNLEQVPLGMDTQQTVAAQFTIGKGYQELPFYERLEARLRSLPGNPVFAIADNIPPYGGSRSRPYFVINVEGRPPLPEGTGGMVGWRYVTPGYFAAMGIPMVRGRAFTEEERSAQEMPIILSRELARRLFPEGDALRRHILSTSDGAWHTVVGIAGDVINNGLDHRPDPEYYELRKHFADDTYNNRQPSVGWRSANVIVRSPLSAQVMADTLRRIVAEMDPSIPVTVQTLEERAGKLTVTPRFEAALLGGFAGVGLLLAAIGIYGVIAFLVGQRTREVGVRMALGATPRAVIGLFLRHAAGWTLAGIVLGLAGSLAVTKLVAGLLFQVGAHDPWSLGVPPALLLAIAMLAAWLPARRAAQIDPIRTLREE